MWLHCESVRDMCLPASSLGRRLQDTNPHIKLSTDGWYRLSNFISGSHILSQYFTESVVASASNLSYLC